MDQLTTGDPPGPEVRIFIDNGLNCLVVHDDLHCRRLLFEVLRVVSMLSNSLFASSN